MEIRRLDKADAVAYWHLRHEALQTEPWAFGTAVEEHRATTVEQAAARISDMPSRSFILGGFEKDVLIGMAMLICETGLKDRHKGHIHGVFVTASNRRKGLGGKLLASIIERAKEDDLLEQILLSVAACQEDR